MLRVVTDNSDNALSLDNLALFAHRLNRRPNFHCYSFPAWINKNALKKGIKDMLSRGKTVEEIRDFTGYPLELIEEAKAELEEDAE